MSDMPIGLILFTLALVFIWHWRKEAPVKPITGNTVSAPGSAGGAGYPMTGCAGGAGGSIIIPVGANQSEVTVIEVPSPTGPPPPGRHWEWQEGAPSNTALEKVHGGAWVLK